MHAYYACGYNYCLIGYCTDYTFETVGAMHSCYWMTAQAYDRRYSPGRQT